MIPSPSFISQKNTSEKRPQKKNKILQKSKAPYSHERLMTGECQVAHSRVDNEIDKLLKTHDFISEPLIWMISSRKLTREWAVKTGLQCETDMINVQFW